MLSRLTAIIHNEEFMIFSHMQWYSRKVMGLNAAYALSVFGWSGFLPHSKDMSGFRLICESKFPVSVNGCLSLCVSCAINC